LPGAQLAALCRLGFFYFNDQISLSKNRRSVSCNLSARREVVSIGKTHSRAAALLYEDAMPARTQLAHTGRCETNSIFVVFNFLWHAY
jgi:hypothetical protein